MNQNPVEQAVEMLCLKGCKALWADIAFMEKGGVLPELANLDEGQRREVLAEIKSIMAVYEGSCSL